MTRFFATTVVAVWLVGCSSATMTPEQRPTFSWSNFPHPGVMLGKAFAYANQALKKLVREKKEREDTLDRLDKSWDGAVLVNFDAERPAVTLLPISHTSWKLVEPPYRAEFIYRSGSVWFFRLPSELKFQTIVVDTAARTVAANSTIDEPEGGPLCDVMVMGVRRSSLNQYCVGDLCGRVFWFEAGNALIKYGPAEVCGDHFDKF